MGRLARSTVIGVFIIGLNGCAGTTLIKNLALPPVSIIEGNITQLDENGFTLTDHSGSIYVRAKIPDNRKPDLSVGDRAKVYGNLQGDPEKTFDGYVIRKPTGKQIIIRKPTPHFGFIIQSSFE